VFLEGLCNLTVSYANHFVPSSSDVLFSFHNQFFDIACCCLVALSMGSVKEERICIIFSFRVGKIATETHRMLLEAHGDDALSQTTTLEWFSRFKTG
jgi:hypothetical protein